MARHCSVCRSTHHDRRFHHRRRNPDDVQGFEEGGVFHPIRGSKGYSRARAGEPLTTGRGKHKRLRLSH
jgi:hypothetical protein